MYTFHWLYLNCDSSILLSDCNANWLFNFLFSTLLCKLFILGRRSLTRLPLAVIFFSKPWIPPFIWLVWLHPYYDSFKFFTDHWARCEFYFYFAIFWRFEGWSSVPVIFLSLFNVQASKIFYSLCVYYDSFMTWTDYSGRSHWILSSQVLLPCTHPWVENALSWMRNTYAHSTHLSKNMCNTRARFLTVQINCQLVIDQLAL